MKKSQSITLSLIASITLLLSGCGNEVSSDGTESSGGVFDQITANPDVEGVKNGVMIQYSEAVTVGKVLDNWEGCNNPTWEAQETQRGEKMVRFSCDLNKDTGPSICDDTTYMPDAAAAECEASKIAMQHLVGQQQGIVFSLSADGTSFMPASYFEISTFDDGKKYTYETTLDMLIDGFLKKAYANQKISAYVGGSGYEKRQ